MTRVDFYILDSDDDQRTAVLACRIAEKAVAGGHRVFLRVGEEAELARMDALLWTFRDGSFLPHARDDAGDADEPVLLGHGDVPASGSADVLVNLAPTAPAEPEHYTRIADLGNQGPETLRAARQRFRWYRDRGLEPNHHTV